MAQSNLQAEMAKRAAETWANLPEKMAFAFLVSFELRAARERADFDRPVKLKDATVDHGGPRRYHRSWPGR